MVDEILCVCFGTSGRGILIFHNMFVCNVYVSVYYLRIYVYRCIRVYKRMMENG